MVLRDILIPRRLPLLSMTTRVTIRTLMVTGMLWGTAASNASDLKQRIKVRDANVRLSDVFTDVAESNDKNVFASPMPGQSKNISISALWKIANVNGIQWEKPQVNKRIRITREGNPVDLKTLTGLLREEVKNQGVGDDVQLSIFGQSKTLYLPINSDESDIEIDSLTISSSRNRYRAKLLWPLGDGSYQEVEANGTIELVRLLPVLNRTLLPGEIITKRDISWVNIPIKRITSNAIQSEENFIGFTPKRALVANKMLRNSDLEALKFVKKGSQVTITYISGPLRMNTIGKALQHGAMGDAVRILNMGSNKTIIAQVTGHGQVEVVHRSNFRQLASR